MTASSIPQSAQGRELLLIVARRLFLERGYAQVSIQQIAEEANMTKGAPYYHFANKQELFISVCLEIFFGVKKSLDAALNGDGSLHQRIERATLSVVRSMTGDFSMLYSDLLRIDNKDAFGKAFMEAFGSFEMADTFIPIFEDAELRGEIGRVSAQTAATTYFLILKASIDHCTHTAIRHPDEKVDIDALVKQTIDIYFHGIV